MNDEKAKILVVPGNSGVPRHIASHLAATFDVEVVEFDHAAMLLEQRHFDAIIVAADEFLPLERAFASKQAELVLNTINEGVCIMDAEGRCNWMNRKMTAWPPGFHERIRRHAQMALEHFTHSRRTSSAPLHSRRYTFDVEEETYLELIASPVLAPDGTIVQLAAVVCDATHTRRLQRKLDAIDRAGYELVRLEADAIKAMNVTDRLKLIEEKIIGYTRELMHFDHFNIRLLDRRSGKLELVISAGLPEHANQVELFVSAEGNGISGYVAQSARSYICPDTSRDVRYVDGLDQANSSLTVPLMLHDKVIGVFNIESRRPGAFTEEDRQFAEIFSRYVAMAFNTLDLLVVERSTTSHKVADEVTSEIAGPLNDITIDAEALMEEFYDNPAARERLRQILENVSGIRQGLHQAQAGPNSILGAKAHRYEHDPLLDGARILVVDDEPNMRTTIGDILRKYRAEVTTAADGQEAIAIIEGNEEQAGRSFDLVLSDIRMPDRSGYDVFAASHRRDPHVPVILMTGFGYDPNHSIVRASQEGLYAVLFKPFRVDQLLCEVRKAVASRRGVSVAT
ncbi:MAG: response regulator [Phycisphaerae bacterium]